jgi:hypothetical protein
MNNPILVLCGLMLIVAFARLFYWDMRQFYVDRTRQRLFELRDSLFDQAVAGLLAFDSPAYGLTRRMINGSIRYIDELSIFQLATLVIMARDAAVSKTIQSAEKEYSVSLSRLTPKASEYVTSVRSQAHKIIAKHVFQTSLLLQVLIGPLLIIAVVFMLASWMKAALVRLLDRSQAFAALDTETSLAGVSH